ncbi:hypothetical protein C8J57DRAFT_1478468 [Mycena rebaudengoi]|nr:hypothetical protein C8J57DRAFT_1478468 [Mycena rebaudengoi]
MPPLSISPSVNVSYGGNFYDVSGNMNVQNNQQIVIRDSQADYYDLWASLSSIQGPSTLQQDVGSYNADGGRSWPGVIRNSQQTGTGRSLPYGLPDRYFREALQIEALGDDEAGPNFCQRLLVAILQIPGSGNDPIVRTLALLSVVCLCAGTGYAATLVLTFGRLETVAERRLWIRAIRVMPQHSFWNPWIMLAMPLAWIGWGVFYGVVLIGAFIWRDGATNEPDENSRLSSHQAYAYGPKVVETLIYVVSLGYFGLMVKTLVVFLEPLLEVPKHVFMRYFLSHLVSTVGALEAHLKTQEARLI